ncbi:MAG: hypothetical protein MZV49_14720 [Rhodopseudomonas palustris]|nr:hypothetical protein [Rhodopseudomonas palustris]
MPPTPPTICGKLDALDGRDQGRDRRRSRAAAPQGDHRPTTRSAISPTPTASTFIAPAGRLDRCRGQRPAPWPGSSSRSRREAIPAVFIETITDPRLMRADRRRDRRPDRRRAVFRQPDR